jgi:hypothetical protein
MKRVAILAFDSTDNKTIMVVVTANNAYANKDGKHIGNVVAAVFVPIKDASVDESDSAAIVRASFALRNVIS